ncbi:MAG: hypothetical protein IK018_06870 [Lachnospiraceae bacterium]|nr:hypothetical protein [Lachnospiraceae bacterium]
MGKFERKFGRYAIKNLSKILVICYAAGLVINLMFPGVRDYITLNPYLILHGQVWRLVSWVLVSSFGGSNPISLTFSIIMMFFFFSIGRTLERTWGDYLFNVYVFSGILLTIIASFGVYGFSALFPPVKYVEYITGGMEGFMAAVSPVFTLYYISMSILLAFAFTFPDSMVLMMLIFPMKMKWLGYIEGIYLIYEFAVGNAYVKVAIAAAMINFIVFYFMQRKRRLGSPKARYQAAVRRREFNNNVRRETKPAGVSKHKCAICGRTEITNPELQFRFCSKCNGNYEYCNEHLFNHKHVE